MKICPRCQKTYRDENLNFCLDDGAVLMQSTNADDAIPATVMMNQPRPTAPSQQLGNQGAPQGNWGSQQQNQFSMQPPPKKSKTWMWVVGILGGLMLLCGGGFVGLIFLGASLDKGKNENRTIVSNTLNYNSSVDNKSNANSNLFGNGTTQTIDLSKWVKGDTDLGSTEYTDGELLMSSKKKNYYYVLAAQASYKTENAVTKLTARNISEDKSNLGFGLIVNSNPVPLTQDYAFLIDSENKKYRVVRHTPGDEVVVVGWTRANAIKDGTQENVLEVRDLNKTMNFYINGEFIRTVGNTDGYAGGVAGIYAGDAVQVAFSDLQITK